MTSVQPKLAFLLVICVLKSVLRYRNPSDTHHLSVSISLLGNIQRSAIQNNNNKSFITYNMYIHHSRIKRSEYDMRIIGNNNSILSVQIKGGRGFEATRSVLALFVNFLLYRRLWICHMPHTPATQQSNYPTSLDIPQSHCWYCLYLRRTHSLETDQQHAAVRWRL